MTTMNIPPTEGAQTAPPPETPRRWPKRLAFGVAFAATFGIGNGIGTSTASSTPTTVTHTVTLPGKTVTKTVPVPGATKTVIKTLPVPGPTKTVIKTVPAPPPPVGAQVGLWSGAGNENTPAFNVPASGDYIVSWTYSGNVDNSLGSSQPSNFSIQATNQASFSGSFPNDIAASGHGSTEVTGVSGVDSFNVTAIGSWTIKVVAAQ